MAILWKRNIKGVTYEVRSAGNTRRLYTDGVFHSQYNPRHPVGGSVWDLLLLPAFFSPRGTVKRVLVLGVGGGAVIRQLGHFLDLEQVVGVELNPVHLQVAKRFFGLDQANVELVEADAVQWVKDYRGPKFDLIIDDLFGEVDGEPVRAVAADRRWMAQLEKHLAPAGTLVMNFDSHAGLRGCAYFKDATVRRRFHTAFQFTTRLYENHIGAFLKFDASKRDLLEEMAAYPALDIHRRSCRLKFAVAKAFARV